MACALCKTRREKRHCPGVQGEICAICCGEQREETVACPLECEYLQHAHQHEKLEKDPEGIPNRDFPVPQNFLHKNVQMVVAFERPILRAALKINAIDNDIRDALDGLVKTYRTLGSGLYYKSRPTNPLAAAIYDEVQNEIAAIRKMEQERGIHKLLDSQILTVLVFLQHLEYAFNNGRRRGRCFLDNIYNTMADIFEDLKPDEGSLLIS